MKRISRSIAIFTLASGLVLVGSARDASACAPSPEPGTTVAPLPEQGATGVPRNVRVLLLSQSATTAEGIDLKTASGTSVAFTASFMGPLVVLQPDVELASNTEHVVTRNGAEELRFTTGSDIDLTMPSIPTIKDEKGEDPPANYLSVGPGSCGPGGTPYVRYTLEHNGDVLLVDYDGESTLDPVTLNGSVSDASKQKDFSISANDKVSKVRFGALDMAGNFSGWSDYRDVEIPEESPGLCACAKMAPRGVTAWGVALLLGLGVLLRRRTQ